MLIHQQFKETCGKDKNTLLNVQRKYSGFFGDLCMYVVYAYSFILNWSHALQRCNCSFPSAWRSIPSIFLGVEHALLSYFSPVHWGAHVAPVFTLWLHSHSSWDRYLETQSDKKHWLLACLHRVTLTAFPLYFSFTLVRPCLT